MEAFLLMLKKESPLAPLLIEDYPRDEDFSLGESYGSLDKDFPLKTKKCRAEMMRLSKQAWEQGSSKERQGQESGLSPRAKYVPKSSEKRPPQKCAFFLWRGGAAVILAS